ncbi:hypothetical protein D0T87_05080 [Bacteroides sp. 51]|nr:hypothetical protein [Bacteroides sp. 51]
MISLDQIRMALKAQGLVLVHSSVHRDRQRLAVELMDLGIEGTSHITVMGVRFEFISARKSLLIYECVFANEVLQGSIHVGFECSK